MGRLALTEENLQNQIAVVKEEILVNVLNQPYGGFPWLDLPQAAFTTFPNAHNSYGDFADLESASLDDAREFYERYYAPGNAVLVVGGALDGDESLALVERHLGGVPARATPSRPDFGEPVPTKERRKVRRDDKAPEPALAVGYRVPDPVDEWDDYLAMVMAGLVLADGEASRLYQRLVKRDRVATGVGGGVGLITSPFETRDPTLFAVTIDYHGKPNVERLLRPMDDEIERFREEGPSQEELDRFRSSALSQYLKSVDNLVSRVDFLATITLLHDRPRLVNELPAHVRRPTPGQVREAAARWLDPRTRTLIDLRPRKAS
jgi:predicted Zn-dependent peptidase